LCGLFAAGLGLAPARAQEEPQVGYLEIEAGPRGDARASLWFEGVDTRGLAGRVRRALPCELEPEPDTEGAGFAGSCPGLFQRNGSAVQGRIDLRPLLRAAALKPSFYFSVDVHLPASALRRCGGWDLPYLPFDSACRAVITSHDGPETAADLAYGFRASDLAWRFGLLGALALAPIPLLLRRRRRVLATAGGSA
jgi:hypothetical protein